MNGLDFGGRDVGDVEAIKDLGQTCLGTGFLWTENNVKTF